MNKPFFAAILLAGSGIALTACGAGTDEATTAEAEEGIAGLSLAEPKLVLPAVEGNPGAIYFDLVNESERNYAVRKAEVEGAGRTEVHATMEYDGEMTMGETGPQTVMAGDTMTFEPGGLHVMVFDLSPELQAGGTTQMTLTVAGGKTATFDVPIQAAGDDR